MQKVVVINNQSIWDLAIQNYGDASGAMQLILDNPTVCNFQDSIAAGTKLVIDESKIINKAIVDYFKGKGWKPTTAVNNVAAPTAFSSGFSLGFK